MGKIVLGMTISLDGLVNDATGSMSQLYPDLAALNKTALMQETIRETGAVIMGRKSFAMSPDADLYADHYEFQVPIFVVTHQAPERHPRENDKLTFTFVTDGIESAVAQAKAAAGSKDVTIIGSPSIARQCLKAGLVDELQVDIMPVILCQGLRLFDDLCLPSVQLERFLVAELPMGRTHLRFRVIKV